MDLSLSKEKQLLKWVRDRHVFSKVEVISYGIRNYYIRADRTIRDFVREGIVKRLNKDECNKRNLKGNMAWYEFVSAPSNVIKNGRD
ncbi:MAG: hypothetical protein AB7S78_05415 [Candidatus Omnitrophota bacterium]